MSSDFAIRADGLSKCYQLYDRPSDRLKQMLWGKRRRFYREFWALRDVRFAVGHGEVLGIIGRNGAGKSTLLQLICGTLQPSGGDIAVNGRIAALLELGAGFNPEFTGRENVFLSAAVMGLGQREIEARMDDILAFADIGDFVDQPVKSYSSGMFVRLAFSVATSVDPDILVVDEALAVGDGDFSRKSFERILALKDAGKTILFCSHALYQIEALCNSAIWLDQGQVRAMGRSAEVVVAYNEFLETLRTQPSDDAAPRAAISPVSTVSGGPVKLTRVAMETSSSAAGSEVRAQSAVDDVIIHVEFDSDPAMAAPSVGAVLVDSSGRNICSAGSHIDKFPVARDASGRGRVKLTFPRIPLLKGSYWLEVYLLCDRGIHVYDYAKNVSRLTIIREDLEQGVVSLPRRWS